MLSRGDIYSHFLVSDDVKYLLRCRLTIWTSPLVKYLLQPLTSQPLLSYVIFLLICSSSHFLVMMSPLLDKR